MDWDETQKVLTIQFLGSSTIIPKEEIVKYKDVVKIVIQTGFKKVPERCFYGCTKLTTISFPDSIEEFEDNIIQSTKVQEIHIPLHTRKINNNNPFDNTQNSLKKFTITPNHDYFTVVDDVLYTKDLKRIIAYPPAKQQKTFLIPNKVKTIGSTAFESCTVLQNLIIPPSITSIESCFCVYMKTLQSITFLYSESSVDIAKSRIYIEKGAFLQGSSITESDIEWTYIPKLKSPYINSMKRPYFLFSFLFLFCIKQ